MQMAAAEFKAKCLALLDRVHEHGESITITKRGVPVAVLSPAEPVAWASVSEAAAALRSFRSAHPLDGLTIRELIDEGRR